MQIWDNVTVGILTKVNELAERYRLNPCDFSAIVKDEEKPDPVAGGRLDGTGRTILEFTSLPSNLSKKERFELMLETLGILGKGGRLVGEDEEIFEALNHALEMAPRPRSRF